MRARPSSGFLTGRQIRDRAEAERKGFKPVVDEAELAMGEIEIRGSDPARGRARLARLQSKAESQGFGSIARRAENAARGASLR